MREHQKRIQELYKERLKMSTSILRMLGIIAICLMILLATFITWLKV